MKTTIALSTAIASVASLANAQPVTISDDTFANASWSVSSYQYGINGGSGDGFQVLTGGNTGAARYVINNCGAYYSGATNVHLFNDFTYVPAISGPLTDLSFTIDTRYVDGLQAYGFMVTQGSNLWAVGYYLNTDSWQTTVLTPTAADFTPFNNGPALPDFSAAGAPIKFGFYSGNSSAGGWGYSRTGYYDNFAVTFVPAPTTAALALIALGASRRRAR